MVCPGAHIPLGVRPVQPSSSRGPLWESRAAPESAQLLRKVEIRHQHHQKCSRTAVLKVEELICVCSLNPDLLPPLRSRFGKLHAALWRICTQRGAACMRSSAEGQEKVTSRRALQSVPPPVGSRSIGCLHPCLCPAPAQPVLTSASSFQGKGVGGTTAGGGARKRQGQGWGEGTEASLSASVRLCFLTLPSN